MKVLPVPNLITLMIRVRTSRRRGICRAVTIAGSGVILEAYHESENWTLLHGIEDEPIVTVIDAQCPIACHR